MRGNRPSHHGPPPKNPTSPTNHHHIRQYHMTFFDVSVYWVFRLATYQSCSLVGCDVILAGGWTGSDRIRDDHQGRASLDRTTRIRSIVRVGTRIFFVRPEVACVSQLTIRVGSFAGRITPRQPSASSRAKLSTVSSTQHRAYRFVNVADADAYALALARRDCRHARLATTIRGLHRQGTQRQHIPCITSLYDHQYTIQCIS